MEKKFFYAMTLAALFGMASCDDNDEPQNDPASNAPGMAGTVSDTITIDMDALPTPATVAEAIWDAYGQGYTKFAMKGSYEKLGCYDSGGGTGGYWSPFKDMERVLLIDLTGVTGFPEVEAEPGVFMPELNINLGDYLYEIRLPEEVQVLASEIDSYVRKLSMPGVVYAKYYTLTPPQLYSLDAPKLESVEGSIGLAQTVSSISFPSLTDFGEGFAKYSSNVKVDTLKLTAKGSFTMTYTEYNHLQEPISFGTFYSIDTESCTLYLHQDKKTDGGGSPAAAGNQWAGETWKKIVFTDDNGNATE